MFWEINTFICKGYIHTHFLTKGYMTTWTGPQEAESSDLIKKDETIRPQLQMCVFVREIKRWTSPHQRHSHSNNRHSGGRIFCNRDWEASWDREIKMDTEKHKAEHPEWKRSPGYSRSQAGDEDKELQSGPEPSKASLVRKIKTDWKTVWD